jgi:hypothetical protein
VSSCGLRFWCGLRARVRNNIWLRRHLRICEVGGTRRTSDRVTWRRIGLIFVGVTRAGAASRRPYGKRQRRRQRLKKFQISDLKFQIRKKANANANENENADPSPLKRVRDHSRDFFSLLSGAIVVFPRSGFSSRWLRLLLRMGSVCACVGRRPILGW